MKNMIKMIAGFAFFVSTAAWAGCETTRASKESMKYFVPFSFEVGKSCRYVHASNPEARSGSYIGNGKSKVNASFIPNTRVNGGSDGVIITNEKGKSIIVKKLTPEVIRFINE